MSHETMRLQRELWALEKRVEQLVGRVDLLESRIPLADGEISDDERAEIIAHINRRNKPAGES